MRSLDLRNSGNSGSAMVRRFARGQYKVSCELAFNRGNDVADVAFKEHFCVQRKSCKGHRVNPKQDRCLQGRTQILEH